MFAITWFFPECASFFDTRVLDCLDLRFLFSIFDLLSSDHPSPISSDFFIILDHWLTFQNFLFVPLFLSKFSLHIFRFSHQCTPLLPHFTRMTFLSLLNSSICSSFYHTVVHWLILCEFIRSEFDYAIYILVFLRFSFWWGVFPLRITLNAILKPVLPCIILFLDHYFPDRFQFDSYTPVNHFEVDCFNSRVFVCLT